MRAPFQMPIAITTKNSNAGALDDAYS